MTSLWPPPSSPVNPAVYTWSAPEPPRMIAPEPMLPVPTAQQSGGGPLYWTPYAPIQTSLVPTWGRAEAPPATKHSSTPAINLTQADLQRRYPGAYARKANPLPLADALPNLKRAGASLWQTRTTTPVKDDDLANLDDHMKRAGSLLIATLATLGLKQRVFGVGEFLGFASWFGAMAATPQIINGLVRLKTGVNLGQKYDSTYGQRQNVFKDPNYLPLHILPDEEIGHIADRLNIPPETPERRQVTESKMRQIAAQTQTWWMLVAGPATPVLSGLVCDQLQDPATRMLNGWKQGSALRAVQRAATGGDAQALARQTDRYLRQLVGDVPESTLSSWWKQFGRTLVRQTDLHRVLRISDVVNAPREAMLDQLTRHLSRLDPNGAPMAQTTALLQEARWKINSLQQQAHEFLAQHRDALPEAAFNRQQKWIEARAVNAHATLTHYDQLFKAVQAGQTQPETIRRLLQKPVLSEVQKLLDAGLLEEATRLAGGTDNLRDIQKALSVRQYGRAFQLMGASPASHLMTALKESKLRQLWQRRVPGMLGGGLLGATALFNWLVVGRDFQPKSSSAGKKQEGRA